MQKLDLEETEDADEPAPVPAPVQSSTEQMEDSQITGEKPQPESNVLPEVGQKVVSSSETEEQKDKPESVQ